ncbi:MAG: hypothetical protein AAF495_16935 [Pseudomonadota bacterium]
MIAKILEPGFEGDGKLSNDLHSAFLRGYPIENLRPLLISKSETVLGTAAFLVTELGWVVHPFVAEIVDLLYQPRARVRFDAIQALARCTTPDDGWALGRVLQLLGDPDDFVRGGAMWFIRVSSRWQLRAALDNAAPQKPDSVFSEIQSMYLRRGRYCSTDIIRAFIKHPHPIARRFGVGLAARPRLIVDETLLSIAIASEDEEIRDRAAEFRGWIFPADAILSSAFIDQIS